MKIAANLNTEAPAAIGHTMWNSAMVLLLDFEAKNVSTETHALRDRAYQHALKVAGVIETNDHTYVRFKTYRRWITDRAVAVLV